METVTKIFTAKADKDGNVVAVISTYGIVDSDNDIVVAGAFQEGQSVLLNGSYDHNAFVLGGVGTLHNNDKGEVEFRGKTLDTEKGDDLRTELLETQHVMQWSYRARILEREYDADGYRLLKALDPIDVGPVLRGSNHMTRTVTVKSDNKTVPFDIPKQPVTAKEIRFE